MGNQNS